MLWDQIFLIGNRKTHITSDTNLFLLSVCVCVCTSSIFYNRFCGTNTSDRSVARHRINKRRVKSRPRAALSWCVEATSEAAVAVTLTPYFKTQAQAAKLNTHTCANTHLHWPQAKRKIMKFGESALIYHRSLLLWLHLLWEGRYVVVFLRYWTCVTVWCHDF